MRHLFAFPVSVSLLADLIRANGAIDEGADSPRPFPDGARCVRAFYDAELDNLVIVFEHDSFPATANGAHIMRARVAVQVTPLLENSEIIP